MLNNQKRLYLDYGETIFKMQRSQLREAVDKPVKRPMEDMGVRADLSFSILTEGPEHIELDSEQSGFSAEMAQTAPKIGPQAGQQFGVAPHNAGNVLRDRAMEMARGNKNGTVLDTIPEDKENLFRHFNMEGTERADEVDKQAMKGAPPGLSLKGKDLAPARDATTSNMTIDSYEKFSMSNL